MSKSVTIVIPNRNRDLNTVRRSIASIVPQLSDTNRLVVVDYGSELAYQVKLEQLIKSFDKIELILCPTQGQLWNKSRCINMVLQSCTTTHFMVSDMDMMWHPQFLEYQMQSLSHEESVYFTVGMLTQQETAVDKSFEKYAIKFQTNEEATGISIFPTVHLKTINGFDEFYHGWGSEDTDVHVRLQHAGYEVRFRESEVLFKHQWHAKIYRSSSSQCPFHSYLEKINSSYFQLVKDRKKVIANGGLKCGEMAQQESYDKLLKVDEHYKSDFKKQNVDALVTQLSEFEKGKVVELKFYKSQVSIKKRVKSLLIKREYYYLAIEVNDLILFNIVNNYRNSPYTFIYSDKIISLKILISE